MTDTPLAQTQAQLAHTLDLVAADVATTRGLLGRLEQRFASHSEHDDTRFEALDKHQREDMREIRDALRTNTLALSSYDQKLADEISAARRQWPSAAVSLVSVVATLLLGTIGWLATLLGHL